MQVVELTNYWVGLIACYKNKNDSRIFDKTSSAVLSWRRFFRLIFILEIFLLCIKTVKIKKWLKISDLRVLLKKSDV